MLVGFDKHLSVGQAAVVHEHGLGSSVLGLRLEEPRQLGDAVHRAPSGLDRVLVFTAGQLPPAVVVTHTIHNDAGEDTAHDEGEDDGDGQERDGNHLIAVSVVRLADHTCKQSFTMCY